ncbi:MAG: helix-turn-helix domain-containing protein [Rhodospirillales bacterium]|nr:helix-turn-helix domain-containing protein [Rhodospirillales bacterium]
MPNDLCPTVLPKDDTIAGRVRSRLAAQRRALGLAPELLDVVCGLRRGTVARLESGKSRVTAYHLFQLAAVFEVEIDWFFAATDPPSWRSALPAVPKRQPGYEEMRQFLAVFDHLGNPRVRAEIRRLIDAVANRACDKRRGCLPVAREASPMP